MGILPARFAPTGIADDLDPRLFCTAIKKPGDLPGLLKTPFSRTEAPILGRFLLDDRIVLGLGLRTATRSLGQRSFDFLDRFGLGDPLHGCDLA